MFSDEVIGLSMRYDAELRQSNRAAQAVVDRQDARIRKLQAQLRQAYLDLERERGRRIVAEARIEELLDTEV
jgi:hypothetical protein